MRILQVVPYFPPAYTFGGPVIVAYQISKMLVKKGHDVVICTTDAKDYSSRIKGNPDRIDDGLKVHRFKNISLMLAKIFNLFITPKLASFLKRDLKRFDVIHLHEYTSYQNIIVYHYARKYGVPYILQAHGSLSRIGNWQRLKWIYNLFFGYRLLRDASKVIALSEIEAQQYRRMGVPDKKIVVIPNGIDLSEYTILPCRGSFKRKFGIKDEEKIILYLGRIHKSKGLDLLVQAFNMVIRIIDNIRLVVVGPDDGYLTTFSKIISDLEIKEKVLLTGYITKNEKLAALIDSDVFVTPKFSGFPITFLEACLMGCPIVTTSNELDWIHNTVGYVVKGSPIALSKAISDILQNCTKQRKFQNNSKLIVQNFDITKIILHFENIYKHVAK